MFIRHDKISYEAARAIGRWRKKKHKTTQVDNSNNNDNSSWINNSGLIMVKKDITYY